MNKIIQIDQKLIGYGQPVYIIAEIGGNFTDFETAKKLIDLAIQAGVDAVKLQHYQTENLTSKVAIFEMENTGVIPQFELFKKYELTEQLTRQILNYCREKNISLFSTPSHKNDLVLLEELDLCAYKIGSDDATNLPFLKLVAQTHKPIILSTGMCTMSEVQKAVDTILGEGNDQLILLHCTTNYPTPIESVNLKAMQTMQNHFPLPVGYSDHTLGIDTCYVASVLGAHVIEFHFTHDKNAQGPDHMLSKDYNETKELVKKVRSLPILLGDGLKKPALTEMTSKKNNRKSIIVSKNISSGEKINPENIIIKRPGTGIPAEHYYELLGKTVNKSINADTPLSWDDVC